MTTALYLLALQGIIGAFDTIYYHEWKAKLPALGKRAAKELRLHAVRDLLYAILFVGLALFQWMGFWAVLLVTVLALEIVFTLWDFVVEVTVRKPLGDVYAGERVTHAIMGILYGAMLVFLLSTLKEWWMLPTELADSDIPILLKWSLIIMGIGVLLSGVRDTFAALELPGMSWPWKTSQ
jgi:hypothetical protein